MRAALIGAGLLLLTGCSQDPAGLPTNADFERAQQAWSEPWLAPERASVPEAAWGSPDGYVRRDAGIRTTDYSGRTPEQALRSELAAAVAAGWRVTGTLCDEPSAALAKGDGLADGMAATVSAERLDPAVRVTVTAYVPHHLDGDWPSLPESQETCVRETGVEDLVEDIRLGAPFGGVDDPPEPDTTEWTRSEPSSDEQAFLAAVNADPWLAQQGVTVGAQLAADDARRLAPGAELSLTGQGVAEVTAAMAAWELTWVSCGQHRATEASLRLVTDHGVAVARLSEVAGRRTEVTVTLPIPETPAPAWIPEVPVLEDPPCLDTRPRGRTVSVAGTPVAPVVESQPVSD